MSRECRYICQRAANAIISEVGTYRVSNDALLGINQFLDEFLCQLIAHCQSLDLSRIKASVFALLPSSLGKNAIVEAELEVKTFTETEVIDYDVYEKMRAIASPFPLKPCQVLLRDKCFEYCTLADKDDQLAWPAQPERADLVISPIVAIYITTVLEHMAEYILTAVAMTCETEDTDYARIKELYLALADDSQVGFVFQKMDLRDKMEVRVYPHGNFSRRASIYSTHMPASPKPLPKKMDQPGAAGGYLDISFDDLDVDLADEDMGPDDTVSGAQHGPMAGRPSTAMSSYSVQTTHTTAARGRPSSVMTSNTSNFTNVSLHSHGSGSGKKSYKVFQGGSTPPSHPHRPTPPTASNAIYDPDAPAGAMNFEDLVRSGNTMRVSLTPNRLKSIEIKNQMLADDTQPAKHAWKRRSSSVPRMSTSSSSSRPSSRAGSRPQTPTGNHNSLNAPPRNSKQATAPAPPPPHASLPTAANGSLSSLSSSSPLVKDDQRKRPARSNSPQQPARSGSPHRTTPARASTASVATATTITAAHATVTTIKSRSSFDRRFEHPRDAPLPPKTNVATVASARSGSSSSLASSSSSSPIQKQPQTPKNGSITSLSASALPTPGSSMSSASNATNATQKTRPSIPAEFKPSAKDSQDANLDPKDPSASTTTLANGARGNGKPLLRRSSGSSRKSRENLRKLKEKEEAAAAANGGTTKEAANTTPEMPTSGSSRSLATFSSSSDASSVETSDSKRPERPSSIVAKRASMVGASRRHSLHESYAINVMEQENGDATPSDDQQQPPMPQIEKDKKKDEKDENSDNSENATTRSLSPSTTSSSSASSAAHPPTPPTTTVTSTLSATSSSSASAAASTSEGTITAVTQGTQPDEKASHAVEETPRSSSPTQLNESDRRLLPPALQRRSSARKSMVLDKVLQFERAHSIDDLQNNGTRQERRASSYIPRRERFMYLQQNPNSLERNKTQQYPHLHHANRLSTIHSTTSPSSAAWVRPQRTSDAIAAAAARFEAGTSLGVQTDNPKNAKRTAVAPPTLIVTDANGENTKKTTRRIKNDDASDASEEEKDSDNDDDMDDDFSEHGVVDGDEEWFLPDEEWEDFAEQDSAVAEWLLGEA
ncbi:hypothetical protein BC940DRAFT_303206 [Gongronella butleri]|nr:hypothetical protein BC940DRAFT_303206 [Gongronella butleri]